MVGGDGTGMRPEDLGQLHTLSAPTLQPGGDLVAYGVSRLDPEQDATVSRVWVHDLARDEGRPFTAGPADRSPCWSPDGSRLAFLRRVGERDQVALLPVDGGEAQVVTDMPLGVRAIVWHPDGERLVVTAPEYRPDVADHDDAERAGRPRRITDRNFRHDDAGWLHDTVVRLWLVDVEGEAAALTPADHSVSMFDVSPEGDRVIFFSARHAERESSNAVGVHGVTLAGVLTEHVVDPGDWISLRALEDGAVALIGVVDAMEWPSPPRAFVLRDGTLSEYGGTLDRYLWANAGTTGRWLLDDGRLLAMCEDRGARHAVLLDADGGHEVLVGGAWAVRSVDADADLSRVVFVADHGSDPGELWVRDGGGPRVLTAHNEALRERLLPVEHMTYERDGVEIDAWVVLPGGDARDVPLLVNIHGGPYAQYGHGFFDEFQVYAAAGYAVVGANPRGSSGRGRAWARAVVGTWHEEASVDILDLEALADAVVERHDRVSSQRLGIMGGSYGGYAAARILARTDRYRAAIVERGLLNWVSFVGTSDIGAFFDRMFLDATLRDDVGRLWEASPLRTADRITTPTLVLHSLEDHRCPPEQAFQLFSVLRANGVDSEMVLFPDEGHELSRSGSPRHRVERFEVVLDWMGRHIPPDAAPTGG